MGYSHWSRVLLFDRPHTHLASYTQVLTIVPPITHPSYLFLLERVKPSNLLRPFAGSPPLHADIRPLHFPDHYQDAPSSTLTRTVVVSPVAMALLSLSGGLVHGLLPSTPFKGSKAALVSHIQQVPSSQPQSLPFPSKLGQRHTGDSDSEKVDLSSPEKQVQVVLLYKSTSGDSATTLVDPLPAAVEKNLSDSQTPRPLSTKLSLTSSASTTLDGDAPSKAAKTSKAEAKAAKRKARREINHAKRKAEAAANEQQPKPPQPWEVAFDQLNLEGKPVNPNSPPADEFNVSTEARRGGSPIPKQTYDLNHVGAVAAVERLVAAYGACSITFSDPSYRIFLTRELDVAISFKVVNICMRKVAVAFGDPVCHPARIPSAVGHFKAFCKRKRHAMAFVGARDAVARVADINGWASIQFAVEQIVDPQTNPVLDGTRGKRQSLVVKKLCKDAPVRVYSPAEGDSPNETLEAQLQAAYEAVYAAKEDRDGAPYSTKLKLFTLRNLMSFLYTVDGAGEPNGLVGLMRVGESKYLLDPLVAIPSAPVGTTDYLTVMAMGYLRRRGAIHMSFGTEPTATAGEIRGMRRFMETDTRLLHAATYAAFGMAGKKTLHDKFHPDDAKRESLHLILASHGVLSQSCCAAAIWRGTHLRWRPVVEPLLHHLEQQKAGAQLGVLLQRLVKDGQLAPCSAELSQSEACSTRSTDDSESDKTA